MLGAWVLAPFVSFALDRMGFARLLEVLAPLPSRTAMRPDRGAVGIERGATLLRQAFRASATSGACLHHAVVQYLLHLRFGPEPRLVIGVRRGTTTPWTPDAHAWVEAAEGGGREDGFRPLLALTPTGGLQRFDGASM